MKIIVSDYVNACSLILSDKALNLFTSPHLHATVCYRRRIEGLPTLRQTIKGTEYIVTGKFSPNARETAVEKMRRVILNAKVED